MKQIVRHGHMCGGLGGAARGGVLFNQRYGDELGLEFECVGSIDVNPAAVADFYRLAGAPGTVMDLMSRDQYCRFHGKEPSAGWAEATSTTVRAAFKQRPHIGVMSTPCKGYTGLLSQAKSETSRYRALNELALRCLWLYLEAFADDPSEFILFENVPRIQSRGRDLLDRCIQLLDHYGYAAAETTHDCGEIGGLHQSRRRFLLVARHREKVPPFLYEAPRRPLRAVGELLEQLPLPGDPAGGPMHRVPSLQWKTWVRLAFVEAGSDWRSLNRLRVNDGILQDYLLLPELYGGAYGVTAWSESTCSVTSKNQPSCGAFSVADPRGGNFAAGTGVTDWREPAAAVAGESHPSNGKFAVADPRIDGHPKSVQMGVLQWREPAGVITGKMFAGGGPHSVADPRVHGNPRYNHVYRIVPWDAHAHAVTGANAGTGGGVADPRPPAGPLLGKYAVTAWRERTGTVIGGDDMGAYAVTDPRPACIKREGDRYETGGHYGVVPWHASAYAVTGTGRHDNGFNSVADPRLPALTQKLVCVIRALDGTWHRPFTTLELAGLQGLIAPNELAADGTFKLEGDSDSAWRERIGNAIPSGTMCEIFAVMGRTLRAAWSGVTFELSSEPVWVRPVAIAIAAAR